MLNGSTGVQWLTTCPAGTIRSVANAGIKSSLPTQTMAAGRKERILASAQQLPATGQNGPQWQETSALEVASSALSGGTMCSTRISTVLVLGLLKMFVLPARFSPTGMPSTHSVRSAIRIIS